MPFAELLLQAPVTGPCQLQEHICQRELLFFFHGDLLVKQQHLSDRLPRAAPAGLQGCGIFHLAYIHHPGHLTGSSYEKICVPPPASTLGSSGDGILDCWAALHRLYPQRHPCSTYTQ